MIRQYANSTTQKERRPLHTLRVLPDLGRCVRLTNADTAETLAFLKFRPVHTLVMTSFIRDNGIESSLNRGVFYGYRGENGSLEGVALIGHATLVEARTDAALDALAQCARSSETPIHLVMARGSEAERFWKYMGNVHAPRLTCVEALFSVSFPFQVPSTEHDLRIATIDRLKPIAQAQAEVAFAESGVDPLGKDKEGFLQRVARRIEQGRVFIVTDGDTLVFKADVIAETDDAIYLEGIYVSPDHRGRGVGSECLAQLTLKLLERVEHVSLLSNVEFRSAHKTFIKAGYRQTDDCTTLFV